MVGCTSRSNRDKRRWRLRSSRNCHSCHVAATIAGRVEERGQSGYDQPPRTQRKATGNVVPSPVYEHGKCHPNHRELLWLSGAWSTHDNFVQTITGSLSPARHTFVKPDGSQLVLGGTRIAALKSLPGWGRERHSEHNGRAFTGVDAACQCPGAKRSRKAFRALGGTGLDEP